MLAVDGPGPVRVYLDRVLSRLNEKAVLDYDDRWERFWFRHPDLEG